MSSQYDRCDEEAPNQQQVIEYDPSMESPPLRKHLRAEKSDPMEEDDSDGEGPQLLTRSNASEARYPAKQPYQGYNRYLFNDSDDDDEDKDLAWFFKKYHPDLHKTNQIAWCRTYANCLAAQIPKNRPKTYKKKAKTEEK